MSISSHQIYKKGGLKIMENYNSIDYAYMYRNILKQALSDLEVIRPHQTKENYLTMKDRLLDNLVKIQDIILES